MKIITSIAIWVVGAVLTIFLFLTVLFLSVVTFPFDKKRKIVNAQGYWWASTLIGLNPFWNLRIRGLQNIEPNKAYVVVANHQSLTDIFVLYKTHMQFRWVAKAGLFKIPFAGWCLTLGKHIKLSQGSIGSLKRAYNESAEWLRKDISVVFFPEGTRSQTGEINGFQNGAFKLAIKAKVPVLPIFINGTNKVLPKGKWIFNINVSGDLIVLPPVDASTFKPENVKALRDAVYSQLKDANTYQDNAKKIRQTVRVESTCKTHT